MTQSDSTPTTSAEPARGTAADGTAPRDPVTGTTDNTTGQEQATENEETDPVA